MVRRDTVPVAAEVTMETVVVTGETEAKREVVEMETL